MKDFLREVIRTYRKLDTNNIYFFQRKVENQAPDLPDFNNLQL